MIRYFSMNRSLILFLLFIFFLTNLSAQELYFGNIIDQNEEPVFGATIINQSTNNGVLTDLKGNFTLEGKFEDEIRIDFLGFKSKRIILSESKDLGNIILEFDVKLLNEVVVIGYGNQKRELLTSSVTSIKGEKLSNEPVLNVTQALQGKAAGLQIIASDAPGASSQVIIRGLGTVQSGREPLYVIDGVLTNNINNINSSDIESVNVLKDAASLAIYGNRGANGVIIITTKKGEAGKTSIEYENFSGIRAINYRPIMANSSSFVTYSNEAILWGLLSDDDP